MTVQTTIPEPRRPLVHLLAGAPLGMLAGTLWRHGGVAPRFYPQTAFLFAGALLRWPGCALETLRVAPRVATTSFDPPLFIVGHWRSGTTFLHNLLSRDPAFCFPTILDALRPYDFYPGPLEFISRRILLRSLSKMRPMDNVPLDPELPQEDELALAAMGAPSFFNCLFFPRHMSGIFAQEVLFAESDGEAARLWRHALRYYLAKLAALNPGRRLLLKNPANSARIPRLRALFPGAKFIHIHRDPAAVFRSTRKLYRSMLPLFALQDWRPNDVDEHILWAYPQLMHRLLDALASVPSRELAVVRYEELAANPTPTLRRVYGELGLGDFERIQPFIEAYVAEHPHAISPAPDIDHQTTSRLAFEWAEVCRRLGYPPLRTTKPAKGVIGGDNAGNGR